MTEAALAYFAPPVAQQLRPWLQLWQTQGQALLEPRCWISGDPNPANWGLRQDGTPVLYDWERFGRGTPALDIAIALPALSDATLFEMAAARYLRNEAAVTSPSPAAVAQLAQEIAIAKVWNIVEFLSMAQQGEVADTSGIATLVELLPGWLAKIAVGRAPEDAG